MNPLLGPRSSDPADQADRLNQADRFNQADPATPRPASQRPWWSRRGVLPGATALSTIALVLPLAVKFPSDLGD